MTAPARTSAAKAKRGLPILEGLLPFDRLRLPAELIAGATLAALAMPEVMGYSSIAGMPVVTGLYTLVLPVALFALFGSSRHLVVGADSATAALMFTGLAGIAASGAPQSPTWVAMAGLAALLCAVFMIAARVLRLGFIANFLSHSVLIGFLTGVGIQVALGQVHGLFGVSDGSGTTLQKFANTLQAIAAGDTSTKTLAVSVAVLVTIVGFKRVNKKIPGALIAVVGSILLSYGLGLEAQGVTTVGTVPAGLPPLGLPAISAGELSADIVALLPIVFSMGVLILAQSAATSRAYAMKYEDSFDENVDLVGLGFANAAAGITGTFVVNGSPTKTQMVDGAGGRSQVAQLTTGVLVCITLLLFTIPLSYLPNATLAAVVFLIGIELVDVAGMRDIARLRQDEFAVALLTATTVVVVGVLQGIILAIILSLIVVLYHVYRPHDRVEGISPEGRPFLSRLDTLTEAAPGLVIYAFGANLFYANTSRFTEEVLQILEGAAPPVKWFAVNAAAVGDIDLSGAAAVRQIAAELGRHGATLVLCSVDPAVRRLLDAYGLTETIGEDRIFDDSRDVIDAYRKSTPTT